MIYFCADDYGLGKDASLHIQQCIDKGAINKVSVFSNFDEVDINKILNEKSILISLHLNLVEGKCLANPNEISLLSDKSGVFKHSFFGLFKLWLFHKKEFEAQLYKEIKEQVLHWKSILPKGVAFSIDSHQHTHMIPAVFNALTRVLNDEQIKPEYMRIPSEPPMPFIKTPSLYFTYSPVNIIKQWLLNFLWLINKPTAKKHDIEAAYFFGILFSGKMDEKRVNAVLPKFVSMAQKNRKNVEVLFHPGFTDGENLDFKDKNIAFEKFYLSKNRKTEFDSVMKISERSVF